MSYNPHFLFRNRHFNTVYRTIFHQTQISYNRKRLETKDGDFLDLDFSTVASDKIVIIIHGLEGSSDSNYVKSAVGLFNRNDYDVLALNLRGCSGEPNRLESSYHSGKTEDLREVISDIQGNYNYKEINLIGYSLGGNIVLKYLGESSHQKGELVKSAVTISVPCDLKGSAEALAKAKNMVYTRRFLKSLKKKTIIKLKKFGYPPSVYDNISKSKNFYDFDNLYTAPAHGFKDAYDYWQQCSSKQFIKNIKLPTLLITSLDDPFLTESCIPIEEAEKNKKFDLELTKYGGHVGFNTRFGSKNKLWLENRMLNFIQNQ